MRWWTSAGSTSRRAGRLFGRRNVLALGTIAFASLPAFFNPYELFAANLALIYIMLAVGLNFLIGYGGQLAFAHGALFGIGAYGAGLLRIDAGWPFWLSLPAGALLAMVVGVVIALPALRLRGLYLALATVAFAQFTLWVFIHWDSVTHGNAGFVIEPVDFAAFGLSNPVGMYYLSMALAVASVLVAYNIVRSRVGRALIAVRESEVAAEALAVNITTYKTVAYGLSALYAGLAGGLFTGVLGVVVPESFNLFEVVLHFCMVLIGGLGSIVGSIIGAVGLIWLREALRGFQEAQEIAFGFLLLATLVFFPSGIVGALKRWVPGWDESCNRASVKDER